MQQKNSPKGSHGALLLEKLEKSFLKVPEQLTMLCNKSLTELKLHENSLKKAVDKAFALVKKAESRVAAVKKVKTSPATKKQLKEAQHSHENSRKALNVLNNSLEEIQKRYRVLSEKQKKLLSLRKLVADFEKQWNKKPQNPKKIAKPKTKPVVRPKTTVQPTIALKHETHTPLSQTETKQTPELIS